MTTTIRPTPAAAATQRGPAAPTGLPSLLRSPRRRALPRPVEFTLLASIIVFFLASSSAPTPLYGTYQAEWHFSPITTTVVFGTYALAVLVALLTVGKLSDHIGRRPVLLAAIAVQLAAMGVFLAADGVPELLIGRVLQGIATGAAAGAVGAGLLDLNRLRGTLANAVATPIGTATGALGAGLLVQFLPARTHLVYVVLMVIFALQAVGVLVMSETVTPKAGALASLVPDFALPAAVRRPLVVAVPALVSVWALAGFYGSVGPALTETVTGSSALVLGGLGLFTLAGAGALAVLLLRNRAPRLVMQFGLAALIVGVGVSLVGVHRSSTTVFFVGNVLAGVGFGGGFQGSVRTVLPFAEAHQRSGVLSVIYTVCYLAMGLPAVAAGFLVVDAGGLLDTAYQYGGAVMVLAAVALGALSRRR